MIYFTSFTSDLHFGHRNILSMTQRPFETVEEMDSALITNWNGRICPKDEVYILGDITLNDAAGYAMNLLQQLNGRKYLVRGNHDKFLDKKAFDLRLFEWVKDYHSFYYQKRKFVLFHYPINEWDCFYRGAIHLHGHQHNHPEYNISNAEKGLLCYDVGVDANDMMPINIEEILTFFERYGEKEIDTHKIRDM